MATGVSGRFSRVFHYDTLLLTAGIWFLAKFLRYALPALFPVFQTEFDVSNAFLGTAFTAMMIGYSLMQFPSGVLADRFGAVQVIVAGAVVAASGALVLGISAPLVVLLGGMLLIGLGTGVHKTVSIRLLARVYPDRTGRALGLFDTLGAFGGVAAPTAAVIATDAGNWHALFLVGAVVGVALAGGVFSHVPRRASNGVGDADGRDNADHTNSDDDTNHPNPETNSETNVGLRRYLSLFQNRRFSLFVGVTLCFGFAYNGVVAFLPLYLTDNGLTDGTASLVYSALFAVSFVQIVTGDLSDRIGQLPLTIAVLAVAAAALGALVVVGQASALVLGATVVAFGLGSHGFRPIRGAYLSATIPGDVAGGGLGLVRTLLMGVGAIAPAIVGIIADTAGFAAAFGLLAVVMAGAVVFAGATALSK
ncbi:Sugar phosphate permease [Haladaptatus litoreus]|uniref:Sugar phosphate permease n=1 Tax=Haladaptatus litoreus TaxID=553468 RepID=A0A1N7E388_9EURY|nr:MFS transporter [Haladaptatus litoreus]SIR82577.1 Sugar phosphate permease [Haladaptatus litoreus]